MDILTNKCYKIMSYAISDPQAVKSQLYNKIWFQNLNLIQNITCIRESIMKYTKSKALNVTNREHKSQNNEIAATAYKVYLNM